MSKSGAAESSTALRAFILQPELQPEPAPGAAGEATIWGLHPEQRLRRSLARQGIEHVEALAAGAAVPETSEPWLLLRGDFAYDERVLAGLADAEGELLLESEGVAAAARGGAGRLATAVAGLAPGLPPPPPEGFRRVGVLDVASDYVPALRKHSPPFVLRAEPGRIREIENLLYAASYKGITDLVTKWVFPLPARGVTRWLAARGVRPNTVTAVSYVLTGLVIWLFAEGAFATGLVAAWLMTFLDTVDGKLARVTLTSSAFGNVLDHGLDLVHPPFWWAAFGFGLAPTMPSWGWAAGIAVVGYVVGRLLEGVFLARFGMEMFSWRPFDAGFRTVIARRNPNLILLSAGLLVGRPDLGFWALAAWTLVCIGIAVLRILQAWQASTRGEEIRPWRDASTA